ncbi:MAG TPA: hypothetical protein VIW46_10770 [Acidimicrobiia bacterium]
MLSLGTQPDENGDHDQERVMEQPNQPEDHGRALADTSGDLGRALRRHAHRKERP